MTTTSLLVGTPIDDADELRQLAADLSMESELAEQQYFNGTPYVDLLLNTSIPATAWLTLRTWITARAERYKTTRITYDGVEIEGVSPKDAQRLIEKIEDARRENNGEK